MITEKLSRKVSEEFGDLAVLEVTNSELHSILNNVKSYWKDTTRHALISLSCLAVGGNPEKTIDAAVVVSLMAAGVSLHDDIVDETLSKHFRKTVLGDFGAKKTLLAGDFLMTKAWTLTHKIVRKINDPNKVADAIEAYGNLLLEMAETGFWEVSSRKKLNVELEFSQQLLWHIAAEMEACGKIGAILGNGQKEEIQALSEFGRRLGYNFGLKSEIEDVLNVEGSLLAKLEFERVPLPLLFASQCSKENFSEINSIVEKSPISPSESRRLLELCFETEALDYIKRLAEQNIQAAYSCLSLLKQSIARDKLRFMATKSFVEIKELCI